MWESVGNRSDIHPPIFLTPPLRLLPRRVDLAPVMSPHLLAESAVQLNLKLMRCGVTQIQIHTYSHVAFITRQSHCIVTCEGLPIGLSKLSPAGL